MAANSSRQNLMKELERATQQVKDNDLDNAIVTLKEILAKNPTHDISLGMLASIYLQIDMVQPAIDLYEKLLETSPENPLARFQLGLAKLKNSQPQDALNVWEPMLTIENEFMAHFHSALAQLELGRQPNALDLLDKARQHMPTAHPLYAQLVDLQSKLSDVNN